jgi:hypothetical protein
LAAESIARVLEPLLASPEAPLDVGNADLTPDGEDEGWKPRTTSKGERPVESSLVQSMAYSTVEWRDVQSFCCRETYRR